MNLTDLPQNVKIGDVMIRNPVGLSPMAGVSDLSFRRICKELGAGYLCTEMVSAKAIVYKNRNTDMIFHTEPDESPVAVQLFGSDPDFMAAAAERLNGESFDILDLNLGCPVPKVVKNHEGSALMKDPGLVGRIVSAMVKASSKPVTVKMRSGFDENSINAPEIARIAEDAGAAAVTVHARTREQFYSGKADWTVIKSVKDSVRIPVFGNGDITDGPAAKAMLEQTGCDGIMIGRAAMGNPWIFREVLHYLKTGEELPKPSIEEIFAMILRHAEDIVKEKGEYIGIREMRAHAAWYTHGFPHAAAMRREINHVSTLDELVCLLEKKDKLFA